ncbi:hypothetical protein [Streptomyces arenae]|uniref:hypothetical protein n=1 Tax=Streptomyces arenae TaxID=29301 RepID=UPI00265B64FA|nr:hypothetical protein [Streptomyces arenae]MCG7204830.1 hypothetical protein [Streptomyces arenae]
MRPDQEAAAAGCGRCWMRPQLEKASKPAYDTKEAAPDQEDIQVVLTVHELKAPLPAPPPRR